MIYINKLLKLASRFEWKVKLAQSELSRGVDKIFLIANEQIETDDFLVIFLSDFDPDKKIVKYTISFYPKPRRDSLPIQLGVDIPENNSLGIDKDYDTIRNSLLQNSKKNIKLYDFILNNKKFESALLNLLATTEEERESFQ